MPLTKTSPHNRPKKLAVMLEGYPFSMGEPFFHEELHHLIAKFDEVLLITKGNDHAPLFKLPDGVQLLTLQKTAPTTRSKIAIFVRQLLHLFKETRNDLNTLGTPLNLLTLKTALAYKEQAQRIGAELKAQLKATGRVPSDYIWYAYWTTAEAYTLASWKQRGLITHLYSRVHGADIYAERHPHNYLPFREMIFGQSDGICCISDHGRHHLWEAYPRYSHRFLLHRLGVVTQEMLPPADHSTKRILSLSGIVPVKNLETLVRALELWQDELIEWHHIGSGGDTPYEKEILSLVSKLLDHHPKVTVRLHGFLPLEEVMHRIQDIRPEVLINVSHYEGIPVSMMECASFGIPLIGPKVCGVPEVIDDGYNGFTFTINEPKEILKVLQRFLQLSDAERLAMGVASRELQEARFNAAKNYEGFAQFLRGYEPDVDASEKRLVERPEIGIVQTGLGNVAAVRNMLGSAGIRSEAIVDAKTLGRYTTVILPGIGSYDEGMRRLENGGFVDAIRNFVADGGQLIGICLGMQLLLEGSEEGIRPGLGLIKGKVKRFPETDAEGRPLPVPHMGWNSVRPAAHVGEKFWDTPMRFYFTHSYHAVPADPQNVLLTSVYGVPFTSAVHSGNVWGFQFHPEKSHHFGKNLFKHLLQAKGNLIATNAHL